MKNALFFTLVWASLAIAKPAISTTLTSDSTKEVSILFALEPSDYIYADSIAIATDNPSICLKEWQISHDASAMFDPAFRELKKVHRGSFELKASLEKIDPHNGEFFLFVTYYQKSKKRMCQLLIPLDIVKPHPQQETEDTVSAPLPLATKATRKKTSFTIAYYHIWMLIAASFLTLLLVLLFLLLRSPYRALWMRDSLEYSALTLLYGSIYFLCAWHYALGIESAACIAGGIYLLRKDTKQLALATFIKKSIAVSILTIGWTLCAILFLGCYLNA